MSNEIKKENKNENKNENMNFDAHAVEKKNEEFGADITKENIYSSLEHDAFGYMRDRDENSVQREEDVVVYATPLKIQRYSSTVDAERKYYNYAFGYKVKINGKEIAQTVQLQPGERRADVYDLLDAIFGDSDISTLYIVRTARTVTVNGYSRTTHSYSCQVRASDEEGAEFIVSLVPSGSTGRVKFNNLISKFKSMGIVE